MKFKMNNCEYEIKEVSQEDLQQEIADEEDGYYYGQTRFQKQLILIDKNLSVERKRKTLIHELTHVYIREYLTTRDINPNEEVLCDIHANCHDIVHNIVEEYFSKKSVYERKKELLKKSKALREIAFNMKDCEKSKELRKKQDDCYKRYMFMKNLTNAMGEVK